MDIRPATFSDLTTILEIYNEAVLNTTASYEYDPRPMIIQEEWYADHLKTGYPIFVATDPADLVVGWSSLSRYHPRYGYRFTAENSVYVAADQRGKGIGKLLMQPLITSAQQLGLHAILAVIDADNQASIRLHASFCFENVGYFKQIGYKFDRWLDVIYMQRLLD